MKAMLLAAAWGVDKLQMVDRPDPEPGPEEVVIAIEAVSINPRDLIMVHGGYGSVNGVPPFVPLCDGAGRVAAVGSQVKGIAIGDLVAPTYSRTWLTGTASPETIKGSHGGLVDGTMQEAMVVPANAVVKMPSHLSAREAATLPCAAVTAWNAIVAQGAVQAGDKVLLQGTGGVSLFALLFAKMRGAEVFITSSSDDKLARAKALGADHLINYRDDPEWYKTARRLTGGEGLDHIVEVAGGDSLDRSIGAVRYSGALSVIGVLDGGLSKINLGRVVTRNVRLQGVTCGSKAIFEDMVQAMGEHQLRPPIHDEDFQFENLGAALEALPRGRHFGKVVCEF